MLPLPYTYNTCCVHVHYYWVALHLDYVTVGSTVLVLSHYCCWFGRVPPYAIFEWEEGASMYSIEAGVSFLVTWTFYMSIYTLLLYFDCPSQITSPYIVYTCTCTACRCVTMLIPYSSSPYSAHTCIHSTFIISLCHDIYVYGRWCDVGSQLCKHTTTQSVFVVLLTASLQTFRPKKKWEKGTLKYELHKKAKVRLCVCRHATHDVGVVHGVCHELLVCSTLLVSHKECVKFAL